MKSKKYLKADKRKESEQGQKHEKWEKRWMKGTVSGESLKPLQPHINNPSQSLHLSGCLELQDQFVRVVHSSYQYDI